MPMPTDAELAAAAADMPSDTLAPGAPSWWEVMGVIAAAVPFLISMESRTATFAGGRVTSFVYRDWVAVIAGVCALLAAMVSVSAVRQTTDAARTLRVLLVVVLAGAGAYHVLHGFGLVGVSPPLP